MSRPDCPLIFRVATIRELISVEIIVGLVTKLVELVEDNKLEDLSWIKVLRCWGLTGTIR